MNNRGGKIKRNKKSVRKLASFFLLLSSRRGSALAYALVIMSVTMIILVSMIGYVTSQLKFSSNRVEREKALQIAEAGVFWYRWYLSHEVAGKTAQQINDFWQSGAAYGVGGIPYEQDYSDPEGGVIGRYSISVEEPESNSTIVIVKSTGWTNKIPNLKRTVQVRFRRPSWSEFAVLANDFMRFGPGTSVYGKMHSNKGIRFDGMAHNIISSLVANYDDPDHNGNVEFGVHTHVNAPPAMGISESFRPGEAPPNSVPDRTDVFVAGRQFPVPEISFSGVLTDLSLAKKVACNYNESTHSCTVVNECWSGGCYYDSSGYGRHIILRSNGTMEIRNVIDYYAYNSQTDKGSNGIRKESGSVIENIPDGGVVFVEDNIWIEGTIDSKKTTFAAANLSGGAEANIYVGMGNILYSNLDGSDILGLIAQKGVEVIGTSLDNLTIDAALIAQSGRVGREHYIGQGCVYEPCELRRNGHRWEEVCTCETWNNMTHKNTITINGSIATGLRYGFAYTDGTGYANRNLNFDNNLLYFPPPYFPTGTQYSIDLWEEL